MKKLFTSLMTFLSLTISLCAQSAYTYDIYNISSAFGLASVLPTNVSAVGETIYYNFTGYTTDPDGMRVYIYPYSAGDPCTDCDTPIGFQLINGNVETFTQAYFTVKNGPGKIDMIKVRITGDLPTDIKREFLVPVQIFYGPNYPYIYELGLISPNYIPGQAIIGEDQVYLDFQYDAFNVDNGYNIKATPLSNGVSTPFYLQNPGFYDPNTQDYSECNFSVVAGNYYFIDEVQIDIQSYDQSMDYGSFVLPANFSFGRVIIDDLELFGAVEANLTVGDEYRMRFDTDTKADFVNNYWVDFSPTMGDSILSNYSGQTQFLKSLMDSGDTLQYSCATNGFYSDGFQFEIKADDSDTTIVGGLDFSFVQNYSVIYADLYFKDLWTSPAEHALSRIGDQLNTKIRFYSESDRIVRLRMTPYSAGIPVADVDPAESFLIELEANAIYNEILSTTIPVACDITHLLIEVLDAGSNAVLLSYMPQVDISFGDLSTVLVSTELIPAVQELKVFPNPTAGAFTIQLDERQQDAELAIYDVLGQLIDRQVVHSKEEELNLELVSPGVYKVVLQSGDYLATQTVIIQ